jgi:hypothetical protein
MTRLKVTRWHPLALSLIFGGLLTLMIAAAQDCRRPGTQRVRTVRKGTTRRMEVIEV